MDIYREIIECLKNEHDSGISFQKMAEKRKNAISYQYIRELVNSLKTPDKLSLDYLFKLFPGANIDLNANNTANSGVIGTNSGVVGTNNGIITNNLTSPQSCSPPDVQQIEQMKTALRSLIYSLDIPPDCKLSVLQALENFRPPSLENSVTNHTQNSPENKQEQP